MKEFNPSPLDELNSRPGYERRFTDAAFWRPYVLAVCGRHGLIGPDQAAPVMAQGLKIRIGIPGTCPVFIVEERWLVKFFGRLYNGGPAFIAEKEAGRLAQQVGVPVPALLAQGQLIDESAAWPWPYLVFEYIESASFGEVYEHLSVDDRLSVARFAGSAAARLHSIPLDANPVFSPAPAPYRRFLEQQRESCAARHRQWAKLPEHWLAQIPDFLLPVDELVSVDEPIHLIHADLTRDHILGRFNPGGWRPLAVIDFGDAIAGTLLYELAAVHLDMFHTERSLLSVFLDEYGLDLDFLQTLPNRAMSMALLHRFDVLGGALAEHPDLLEIPDLHSLAVWLWDIL